MAERLCAGYIRQVEERYYAGGTIEVHKHRLEEPRVVILRRNLQVTLPDRYIEHGSQSGVHASLLMYMLLIRITGSNRAIHIPRARADQIGSVVGNDVRRAIAQTYTTTQCPPLERRIADVQSRCDKRTVHTRPVATQPGNDGQIIAVRERIFGKDTGCYLLPSEIGRQIGAVEQVDGFPISVVVHANAGREFVRQFVALVMLLMLSLTMVMVVMVLAAPGVLEDSVEVAVRLRSLPIAAPVGIHLVVIRAGSNDTERHT